MKTCKIVNVYPEIDADKYPVKTEIDRNFFISCNIISEEENGESFKEILLYLKYRNKYSQNEKWKKILMKPSIEDGNLEEVSYKAEIKFNSLGTYIYTIEGEITSLGRRKTTIVYDKLIEVIVEPQYARFSSWYEMFHRSQGKIPNKAATFKDCEERLEDIKHMGFDVIYFPPIHPIGKTNRKGANNRLWVYPDEPGCPWSVGNEFGGHKSVNPELGTLDDFKHFIKECKKIGIEVALDIPLTCSFDHPYIKEHPGWFFYNPDGTLRFAENPPKKYEDIIPLNFYPSPIKENQTAEKARMEMWNELKDIFIFWINQGVKIFRVDNPHTKPTEFWAWLLKELNKNHPEVVLLSEAFTYYEKLEELSKIGFSQSYTYFTWRDSKRDLIEYVSKLTNSYLTTFLRPNFFTNTPDICPTIIQTGNKAAFKMRVVLAATLSSAYGIYNGYELLDGKAFPGTEIYADSEKYQYKVWDWNAHDNIKDYISKLNAIRRENTGLQYFDNLTFCNSTDDFLLGYLKTDKKNKNAILIIVNVDQFNNHQGRITIPLELCGICSSEDYFLHDLLTNKVYKTYGRENWFKVTPYIEPVYIFRITTSPGNYSVTIDDSSVELANKHFEYFFQIRERVIKNNDPYARRELAQFFDNEIVPKTFIGPEFNQAYMLQMDKLSQMKKYGQYSSIVNMYYVTPGH
ncbi:MAG: DUF3416 domain-containing protein [Bacteroidia bacterium]|nr:DUF3416 domain-containing protein [Bacteroidia bacterium]